jgi:hypothetical protein
MRDFGAFIARTAGRARYVRWRIKSTRRLSTRRAEVAAVRPLLALDPVRPRRRVSHSPNGQRAPSSLQPKTVFAVVPHWRGGSPAPTSRASSLTPRYLDRSQVLIDCVTSLLELEADGVLTAVLTNDPRQTAAELSSHLAGDYDVLLGDSGSLAASQSVADGRKVVVFGWRPGLILRKGFFLTWGHKSLFRQAVGNPGFSHFVYLEDDLRFTSEALSYWCRFREPLAAHGLLPGFVRYEVLDHVRFVVDQKERQDVDPANRRHVSPRQAPYGGDAETNLHFVNLNNPYQGMYVLDRELAIDHLRNSPARSPVLSRAVSWPNGLEKRGTIIRERAALGPIFDDVPSGFQSRNCVPVETLSPGEYRLAPACLVEHLAGNYSRSETVFGKIPVEDLFRPRAS